MSRYDVDELGVEGLSGDHCQTFRGEALRKADLCAAVLNEGSRFFGASVQSPAYGTLLTRARQLLDELDDALLYVNHLQDRSTFERAAALHAGLEELEARCASATLGRRRSLALLGRFALDLGATASTASDTARPAHGSGAPLRGEFEK